MIDLKQFEVWFVTGSQHLYGPETLKHVAEHSQAIARALSDSAHIPVRVVFKPVLKTPDEIYQLSLEANSTKNCIGLVTWMHTFSPAKMWIAGLRALQKPFLHLHTQYNSDIPWADIDMDFMNLNQSAHGDREFGFIGSRMRLERKVVVGHWQDADVQADHVDRVGEVQVPVADRGLAAGDAVDDHAAGDPPRGRDAGPEGGAAERDRRLSPRRRRG